MSGATVWFMAASERNWARHSTKMKETSWTRSVRGRGGGGVVAGLLLLLISEVAVSGSIRPVIVLVLIVLTEVKLSDTTLAM